ncbi:UNVERIFIED_CONTAM: hypothetical protein HHA_453750 [Hammondia hammondi]|eukprot:XP_008887089.1 hypothetical protein HHA_453750 [Hammondia hammondi]
MRRRRRAARRRAPASPLSRLEGPLPRRLLSSLKSRTDDGESDNWGQAAETREKTKAEGEDEAERWRRLTAGEVGRQLEEQGNAERDTENLSNARNVGPDGDTKAQPGGEDGTDEEEEEEERQPAEDEKEEQDEEEEEGDEDARVEDERAEEAREEEEREEEERVEERTSDEYEKARSGKASDKADEAAVAEEGRNSEGESGRIREEDVESPEGTSRPEQPQMKESLPRLLHAPDCFDPGTEQATLCTPSFTVFRTRFCHFFAHLLTISPQFLIALSTTFVCNFCTKTRQEFFLRLVKKDAWSEQAAMVLPLAFWRIHDSRCLLRRVLVCHKPTT